MNDAGSALRTIRTQIPARLDRLPWAAFHWRIVAGLGTVWILDGLEVTIVGSIGARLTEAGSGISMTAADIGTAAAIYVAGACAGALFFGQLTDRFGRKKLMMLTLAVYIVATVATAFAFSPWYFFLCRFFTGAGIGGEYAAINSAIDELIPARNRGRVDITINGSYWIGAAIGGVAALLFLNTAFFAPDFGWRLAFAIGAVLGLGILLVRRSVPESPRWLFIHGHEEEAERIVDAIEAEVREETHGELAEPGAAITVRQRSRIPFRELAKVAVQRYPKRAILGFSLFVGQAFLYNAVTFDLGTILNTFFGVASGTVPLFIVAFAAGNFLGPFLLGRLFDTVGRKPMITGTYFASAVLTLLLAVMLLVGGLNQWTFIALVCATFFFASAGASSAYLTVSEIFPMETRALAIALFYAVGTGVGGIIGPLLFGRFIASGSASIIAIGFFIGAAVMALGGLAELLFGVRAERMPLETIATPLTAADDVSAADANTDRSERSSDHRAALRTRERAEEERAWAAEHRAAMHELEAAGRGADADRRGADERERQATDRDERIRARLAVQRSRDRAGLRRFMPGPGSTLFSPGMVGTASRWAPTAEHDLDREIEAIVRALRDHGATDRDRLAELVGARYWGPGRFREALAEAVDEGRVRRLSRDTFAPDRADVASSRAVDRTDVSELSRLSPLVAAVPQRLLRLARGRGSRKRVT
jgi:MFS family permease